MLSAGDVGQGLSTQHGARSAPEHAALGGGAQRPRARATRQGASPFVDASLALALALAVGVLSWYAGAPAAQGQSTAPHFVLLADALRHGHLWVDPLRASRLGDVTPAGGRYYIAFPPLPALLMLPFVAVAGPGFNDALFTLCLGAANAGLAYLLVRRLSARGAAGPGVPLGRGQALAVAVLFALGTVHFYASLMGRVWFTAHVVAVTALLLYLWECAGRGRPLVAGTALAAAFLARTPTVGGALFWLLLRAGGRGGGESGRRRRIPAVAAFCLPLVLAGALLLAQNAVRFGSPLDFGYAAMRVSPTLAPDLRRYGQFSLAFLPRNLGALLLLPPLVDANGLRAWLRPADGPGALFRRLAAPGAARRALQFDAWGTGLWAVSPALLVALRRPRPADRRLLLAAGLSALAVALPDLLYYNTGWVQFGYRFILDFLPFLLVPVALGLRRPVGWGRGALFAVLLALSVVSNLLGARWFLRLPPF